MNRRGFLQSCLALAAAPAIVRADSLMRIVPRDSGIITFDGCDQWMTVSADVPWEVPGAIIRGRKFVLAKPALFADGVSVIGCEFEISKTANSQQAVIILGDRCSLIDTAIYAHRAPAMVRA